MKLDALTAYGILPAFIERWKATIGESLLDWQADAVRHYGLLDLRGSVSPRADTHTSAAHRALPEPRCQEHRAPDLQDRPVGSSAFAGLRRTAGADTQNNRADTHNNTHNLLVVAPTSSGKTFVGELAAAASLSRRKKAIFIVPLKAIAAEKHAHFAQTFGALGFEVLISTRDHRHADRALVSGNFDIAVVVAEKLRYLLIRNIDLLACVDLVVADELHLLADTDRGPALLSVLEKVVRSESECRLIGLCTRLPAADFLSDFLRARVLRVCRRPIELRRGVLCDGEFRFREDNSGEVGSERLSEPGDADGEGTLRLLDGQMDMGEQILVFGKTKADCQHRAAALAARRAAEYTLNESEQWILSTGNPGNANLAAWYARRIGVHHADLSFAQRRLTEHLFHEGQLRVLFCTGTLAMGVNLPASVVYVEAERFAGGRYGSAPYLIALEPQEFDNAAGRAGRLGLATSAGRAILCAATPVEAEILWDTYIAPQQRDGWGTVKWPPPERRLLEAVACGMVTDHASCAAYFAGVDEHSGGAIGDIDALIRWLADRDFLSVEDSDALCATPAGLVTAASGVSLESVCRLRKLVAQSRERDPVLWTAALMALPESADLRWAARIPRAADPAAVWRELFGDDFESTLARFFPDAFRPEMWYPKASLRRRAVAAALAIGDWVRGEPAEALACAHQAPVGRFEQTAEIISWLVDTAAALADADPQHRSKASMLWKTAFEIRRGLPFGLHDLAEAIGVELPREATVQLARLGWNKPESLAGARGADFHGVFPEAIAQDIIIRAQRWVARQTQRTTCYSREGGNPQGKLWPCGTDSVTKVTGTGECGPDLGQGVSGGPPLVVGNAEEPKPRQQDPPVGWGTACIDAAQLVEDPACGAVRETAIKGSLPQQNCGAPKKNSSSEVFQHSPASGPPNPGEHIEPTNEEVVMSGPLTLDGRTVRSRIVVALGEHTCALRAKSFKYLFALAAARYLHDDGWIDKRDIEPGDNQIKYFYQLRQELKVPLGRDAQRLIENDGSGRYRLALPPERIRFNLERIARFPDWEIKKIAERLSALRAEFKAA